MIVVSDSHVKLYKLSPISVENQTLAKINQDLAKNEFLAKIKPVKGALTDS